MKNSLQVSASQSGLEEAAFSLRGNSRGSQGRRAGFADTLASISDAGSRQVAATKTRTGMVRQQPASVVSPSSDERSEGKPEAARPSGADLPSNTPFGPFDSGSTRPVVDVPAAGEWQAYFMTHAPAEWYTDPLSRTKFEDIYGGKALVTLDWTLTVPDNMDPVWVTNRPLDPTGKPLPRAQGNREIT